MPIYEYECPSCGVFEVFQGINDSPLSRCSTCRRKVKKLISESSFQLKGTGWYVTDYSRKGNGGNGRKSGEEKREATGSCTAPTEKTSSESATGSSKADLD